MRFPKERLRIEKPAPADVPTGDTLVLELKGLDIEGVHRLEIPLSDLESLRSAAGKQEAEKDRIRNLLGE